MELKTNKEVYRNEFRLHVLPPIGTTHEFGVRSLKQRTTFEETYIPRATFGPSIPRPQLGISTLPISSIPSTWDGVSEIVG
jgi:hypothetical protein